LPKRVFVTEAINVFSARFVERISTAAAAVSQPFPQSAVEDEML